jgi:FAD/FMN-containing dehydrogenase
MALLTNLESLVARIGSTARQVGLAVRIDARPELGSAFCTLKAADRETLLTGIRAALVAARDGGHAIVIDAHHGLRGGIDPWGPPASDFPIMQRIKAALDPAGLFVPGRFVGGL